MGERPHLADALEAAALLTALEIQASGGLTEEHIAQARKAMDDGQFADDLMFGGPPERVRAAFKAYADALGVLSLAPGGVKFYGRRLDPLGTWLGDDT